MKTLFQFFKDIKESISENHNLANMIFVIIILFISITSFFHVMQYWSLTNKSPFDVITAIATELIILGSMLAIRYTWTAWIPFIIGTIVQAIGNIFYSFVSIDVESYKFIQFMELFKPWFELAYGDELEVANFKRVLAYSNGLFYLSPIVFLYAKLKLGGYIKSLKIDIPNENPPSTPQEPYYVDDLSEEYNLVEKTPIKNVSTEPKENEVELQEEKTISPELTLDLEPIDETETTPDENQDEDDLKKKWIERMKSRQRQS